MSGKKHSRRHYPKHYRRHYHRGRRDKKKKGRIISNLILIVALVIFAVSAFQLVKIGKGYLNGRSEYDKVRKLAITQDTGDGTTDTGDDRSAADGFSVDFSKLLEINPDTIGWIRFPQEPSQINYPIVQGKNNSEYLKKTFSANDNTLGTIFMDVGNKKDFSDRNTLIYGHRMRDGSMFRHLQDYEDKSFWEKNPYFYIYTVDGRVLKYHIYSACQVLDTSDSYQIGFESDDSYQSFLDMTKQTALYDTGVEVTTQSQIVTLSTCTSASDNHRFVVRGVKEEETTQQ